MATDSAILIQLAEFCEDTDGGSTEEWDNMAKDLRAMSARLKKQEHLIKQMEAAFKSFNNRVMF